MQKKCLKLIFSCGFIGFGLVIGLFLYSLQWKCLDFVYMHYPFYGGFVKELSEAMQRHGYIMQCPDIMPKTKMYFLQTKHPNVWPEVEINPRHLKIAFLGDCIENGIDIAYLHQFDMLLVADEFQNGYLSTFNYRTAYFPLNDENKKFCATNYQKHLVDIPKLAQRLDNIIQGARHEKF